MNFYSHALFLVMWMLRKGTRGILKRSSPPRIWLGEFETRLFFGSMQFGKSDNEHDRYKSSTCIDINNTTSNLIYFRIDISCDTEHAVSNCNLPTSPCFHLNYTLIYQLLRTTPISCHTSWAPASKICGMQWKPELPHQANKLGLNVRKQLWSLAYH